jgi:hypothetical protein
MLYWRNRAGHFDERYQVCALPVIPFLLLKIELSCYTTLHSLPITERPIPQMLTLHNTVTMMMILGALGCCVGSVVAAHQEHLILGSPVLFG